MKAALGLAMAAVVLASDRVPAAPASPQPAEADVQALIERHVDRDRLSPGLAVALVDSASARIRVHGLARRAPASAVAADTAFEIGSITKPMVAALAAVLERDGVLALQDRLGRWLPELAGAPAADITLLQLATHTSGLPRLPMSFGLLLQALRDPRDPYARFTVQDVIGFARAWKPPAEAPVIASYSNLGYALLGMALARASGQPLGDAVLARVLRPAGVNGMRWGAASASRLAHGHNDNGDPVPPWTLGPFEGAGALTARIEDMAALLVALRERRPPFDLDLFAARAARDAAAGGGRAVALGWLRTERHGDRIVWHNGGTGGFRSFVGFSEVSGRGVAVLANSSVSVDALGLHLLNPAFEAPRREAPAPMAWITPILCALGALALLAWWPAARLAGGRLRRALGVPASRLDGLLAIAGAVGVMAFFWVAGDWTLVGRSGRAAVAALMTVAALAALLFLYRTPQVPERVSAAQRGANLLGAGLALLLALWAWSWG